jgi:hypothetical protein
LQTLTGKAPPPFAANPVDRVHQQHRFADLALVPPERWSEADVRTVIRSRPYRDSRDPPREAWQQRVRAFLEAKEAREAEAASGAGEEEACGRSTEVRACTRAGPNGRPVHVGAHQRAVACP